jgi:hypothetical protein
VKSLSTPKLDVYLLNPQTESLPQRLLDMPMPRILQKIRHARHAFVICGDSWSRAHYAMAEIRVALIGPHGLAGYTELLPANPAAPRTVDTFRHENPFSVLESFRRGKCKVDLSEDQFRLARSMVGDFLKSLDANILSALRVSRQFDAQTYNWISISPERRASAIRSYPWLAEKMVSHLAVATTLDVGGGALSDVLMDELNWSRRALKRIARKPTALLLKLRGWDGYYSGLEASVMSLLERTPDHLMPSTHAEWLRWIEIWRLVRAIPDKIGEKTENALFAQTASRRNALEELRAIAVDGDVRTTIRDLADALDAFLNNVFIPATIGTGTANRNRFQSAYRLRGQIRPKLYGILAGEGGLKPLVQLSAEWHRRGDTDQRMSKNERAKLPDDTRMARLIDAPLRLGKLTYEPLLTAGAIRAEAKAQHNCLHSYTDRALKGEIFVFHVSGSWRGKDVNASMTLRRQKNGKAYVVDDIRGYRNAADVDEAIARKLADYVNEAKIEVWTDHQAVRKYNMTRGIDGMLDMPDLAVERAEDSWESWTFLLPKRLRCRNVWEAIEGPFFEIARGLCKKEWMAEKRKALAVKAAKATREANRARLKRAERIAA